MIKYAFFYSSVAIDFDPVDGHVYWTDQFRGITRTDLNGSRTEAIIDTNIDHPDGIAVDWIARNLFWSDTGTDRIEVSRLDGSHRHVLISQDLDEPRDLALDPVNGRMYWSDWGEVPRIERAWMDGTHREIVISDDIVWPNGLALDVAEQKLYWCDAKRDRIEVANVDGTQRRVVIDNILPHPFGLSILGEYIYWTDWQEQTVERANKITGEDRRVLVGHLEDLMSVQASKTSPDLSVTNRCAHGNGGCSHICLAIPNGRVCACPDGFELNYLGGTECVIPEAFLIYSQKDNIIRASINSQSGGSILPIRAIGEAASIDADLNSQRIYWTDLEDKSINRAFVNGSSIETIVKFGLDFPDGIAVDSVTGNVYWTDTGLNRIEVAKSNGDSRRVLLWNNMNSPVSIALDPVKGMMYWSSWSDRPRIEAARMDGSGRKVFVKEVGKANGLTVDQETRRLYWTDIQNQRIAYSSLDIPGFVKVVLQTESDQLYGLTLHKDYLYWADWQNKVIQRANKNTGLDQAVVQAGVDSVMALLAFRNNITETEAGISNLCSSNNGGCPELCLFDGRNAKCECSSHYYTPSSSSSRSGGDSCAGPDDFLLFSQKNKISRLIDNENEVPDLVLPIQGARDIRALGYDLAERMIYWIDFGSKKRRESLRISINRAFDNGTLVRKKRVLEITDELEEDGDDQFDVNQIPYDIAVDYWNRLIFWDDEETNVINVQRLDEDNDGQNHVIGVLLQGSGAKPRALAVHPLKSMLVWIDASNPLKIERSLIDGSQKQTLVNSSLLVPIDLCIDVHDDLVLWADIELNRIERIGLDGKNRQQVVKDGVYGPLVILSVNGDFVYWATRSSHTIARVNKMTGLKYKLIKKDVHHLSSLISVTKPLTEVVNPCVRDRNLLGCSHLCIVDSQTMEPKCTCPHGALGLVLSSDGRTCQPPPTCKPDEFTCVDGSACIPMQWRCDGQAECADHSDEIGCDNCRNDEFRCRHGGCVNASLICDGTIHCDDSSDEIKCCGAGFFQCIVSRECINETKTCDGVQDCSDNSDEINTKCKEEGSDGVAVPFNEQVDHTTSYAIGGIIAVVVMIILILVAVYALRRKKEQQQPDPGTRRQCGDGVTKVLDCNTMMSGTGGGNQMNSLRRGGSSNGQTYDRGQLTGASASTVSSNGVLSQHGLHPNSRASPTTGTMISQPPRPHTSTSVYSGRHHNQRRQQRPHHRGHPGSYGNNKQRHLSPQFAPHNTPVVTDVNEESDFYAAGGSSHIHYPSANNSEVGVSYGYDDFAAHGVPPPTPQEYHQGYYYQDQVGGGEELDEDFDAGRGGLHHHDEDETEQFLVSNPPPSPNPGEQ